MLKLPKYFQRTVHVLDIATYFNCLEMTIVWSCLLIELFLITFPFSRSFHFHLSFFLIQFFKFFHSTYCVEWAFIFDVTVGQIV